MFRTDYPDPIRCLDVESRIQTIGRQRQAVPRIGRRLEFSFLFAAQPKLSANPLNAIDAGDNAMIGQLRLQTLRTVGFLRSLMCCTDFGFQPDRLLLASRWRAFTPGMVTALGDVDDSA